MSLKTLGFDCTATIEIGLDGNIPDGHVLVPIRTERKCVARRHRATCPCREACIGVGIAFNEAQCLA